MTNDELKPCPFCGEFPLMITKGNEHTKKRSAEIYCKGCNTTMRVGAIKFTLNWCIDTVLFKWNTRQGDKPCKEG